MRIVDIIETVDNVELINSMLADCGYHYNSVSFELFTSEYTNEPRIRAVVYDKTSHVILG
jgi:hypothetical protein